MEWLRKVGGFAPSPAEQIRIWTKFAENWDAADLDQARRLARLGIPSSMRETVWPVMVDSVQLVRKNPGSYALLLKRECPREVTSAIERDLGRTFPSLPLFSSRNEDAPGRLAMGRVLRAYAVFDPEIAYCQGINYIVGVLLMHLDEETTFWTLTQLMRGQKYRLNGLFREGLVRLISFFGQHEHLLFQTLPNLYEHFADHGVLTSMYAAPWYQTVFSASFPLPTVFRIWDVFLLEGADFLLQVTMSVLAECEADLLGKADLDSVRYLKSIPAARLSPDKILRPYEDEDSPLHFRIAHTGRVGSRGVAAAAVPESRKEASEKPTTPSSVSPSPPSSGTSPAAATASITSAAQGEEQKVSPRDAQSAATPPPPLTTQHPRTSQQSLSSSSSSAAPTPYSTAPSPSGEETDPPLSTLKSALRGWSFNRPKAAGGASPAGQSGASAESKRSPLGAFFNRRGAEQRRDHGVVVRNGGLAPRSIAPGPNGEFVYSPITKEETER